MAAQRGIGLIILVVLAGLVVGSLLGELLGGLLPAGNARELLTRGPMIGLMPPATVDLRFLAMTFGLSLKVNLVGVVGGASATCVPRGRWPGGGRGAGGVGWDLTAPTPGAWQLYASRTSYAAYTDPSRRPRPPAGAPIRLMRLILASQSPRRRELL